MDINFDNQRVGVGALRRLLPAFRAAGITTKDLALDWKSPISRTRT